MMSSEVIRLSLCRSDPQLQNMLIRRDEGVQYSDSSQRPPATRPKRPTAENVGNEMAKGQIKKAKTNKPKLSAKEKKAKKASKQAAKAAK